MRGRMPAEDWQLTEAAGTGFPSAPKTMPWITVCANFVDVCAAARLPEASQISTRKRMETSRLSFMNRALLAWYIECSCCGKQKTRLPNGCARESTCQVGQALGELQIDGVYVHVAMVYRHVHRSIRTESCEYSARRAAAQNVTEPDDSFRFPLGHGHAKDALFHFIHILIVKRVPARRPSQGCREVRFRENRPFFLLAIVEEYLLLFWIECGDVASVGRPPRLDQPVGVQQFGELVAIEVENAYVRFPVGLHFLYIEDDLASVGSPIAGNRGPFVVRRQHTLRRSSIGGNHIEARLAVEQEAGEENLLLVGRPMRGKGPGCTCSQLHLAAAVDPALPQRAVFPRGVNYPLSIERKVHVRCTGFCKHGGFHRGFRIDSQELVLVMRADHKDAAAVLHRVRVIERNGASGQLDGISWVSPKEAARFVHDPQTRLRIHG